MPVRDLVLVVIVDLLAFLSVAGFAARVLRRGSTPSAPAPRGGVLLSAVAASLLLAALTLPWARATGDSHGNRLATLTGSPLSSLVGLAAVVLTVAALGMGGGLWLRSGSLVVAVTEVVLGTAWCLLALDSLLLTAGLNRGAVGSGHHLAAGPALWLCLLAGLVAVMAGVMATRVIAPVASAAPTASKEPANVDEWGSAGPSVSHQTGDQW